MTMPVFQMVIHGVYQAATNAACTRRDQWSDSGADQIYLLLSIGHWVYKPTTNKHNWGANDDRGFAKVAHTCFSDMDIIGDWIYTTNRIILWRDRGWDQDWAMGVPVAVSPEDHVKRSQYEFIDHICYDIVNEDLWSHGSYYIYIYIHIIYTHILISSLPFYLHMMYPWIPEYWHSHPHPQGGRGSSLPLEL